MKEHTYQTLARLEEDDCVSKYGVPSRQRHGWTSFLLYAALLSTSMVANAVLALHWLRQEPCGLSKYAKLPRDKTIIFQANTDFQSANRSTARAAWEAVDTNPAAVAISSKLAREYELSPSFPFPWDQDKSIYYIKGYHYLHCLKYIFHAVVGFEEGTDEGTTFRHVYHCLDAMRQELICDADDTPQHFAAGVPGQSLADGTEMKCRDWDKMTRWAQQPKFDACYFEPSDLKPIQNSLELYSACRPGSPYSQIRDEYFELHGHRPVFVGDAAD